MNVTAGFLSSSSSSFLFQPFKSPNSKIFNPNPKTLTLICRSESKPTSKQNPMQGSSGRPTPSRNPRKKNSYGSSRRSVIKKTFAQEQLIFTSPVSDNPIVAIIGGGISGMLCALGLEKRGIRSTVFDTGVHGLGGRMGTRIIDPQSLVFDHAAQFFTVNDSHFHELVDGWKEKELVREWTGLIGELEVGGHFVPIPSTSSRYIGVEGMRPLADSIMSQTQSHLSNPQPLLLTLFYLVLLRSLQAAAFDIILLGASAITANKLTVCPLEGYLLSS